MRAERLVGHHRGRALVVRAQCRHRIVLAALDHRLEDRAVFGMLVALREGAAGRHLAEAVGLFGQAVAEASQPARGAARQQRAVELAVQAFPGRVGDVGLGGQRARRARQAVHQQHQRVLQRGVALRDRFAQRQAFQLDAVARQDRQLVPVQRRDAEAAQVGAVHPAFGRQPAQRLAQRARADAVALAHRLDPQLGARRQQAVGDVLAQLLVHRAGARGRGNAARRDFRQCRFSCHGPDATR